MTIDGTPHTPPDPGGTLTEHQVEENEGRARPTLFLALRGDAPLAGGQAFDMSGVRELSVGRGGALALMPSRTRGGARLEVPDPTVSGRHARLLFEDDRVVLEDAGSRNGTRLHGTPVTRAELPPGAWFAVGRQIFVLGPSTASTGGEPAGFGASGLLATFVPAVAELYGKLARLAPSNVPLLLVGETGTGKEVLAREAHALSRRQGSFVPVNCAALPETLVESELFGYRRGAFSDAREDRPGLIRTAHEGTLLLDEIVELPLPSQAKLLRVLQEGDVLALGATRAVPVDVRVIAAAQPQLEDAVRAGRFRADLLARLAGYTLRVPPLRERLPDMGLLVAQLLTRHAGAEAVRLRFTAEACVALFRRRWSLNVRELEQTLKAAVVLAREPGEIEPAHLGGEPLPLDPAAPPEGEALRARLEQSLSRHQGNVSAVARELGKARMQIHRWMDRFGLDPSRYRGE